MLLQLSNPKVPVLVGNGFAKTSCDAILPDQMPRGGAVQLTSKRIELSDALEFIEYFYRENMTDGLPVVPPTEQRVQQFLDAVALSPDARVGVITERASVITAEKLAINAVMAGCL